MVINVLLVDFGTPRTPRDTRPFLERIFGDPANEIFGSSPLLCRIGAKVMARCLAGKSRARYASVTYPRPPHEQLMEMRHNLSRCLERDHPGKFQVHMAMRYCRPLLDEVLRDIAVTPNTRVVIVPLFPHYSRATVGSIKLVCDEEVKRLARTGLSVRFVDSWCRNDFFIRSWASAIRDALSMYPPQVQREVFLLYSAHAIPVSFVERHGDPYVEQTRTSAEAITAAVGYGNNMAVSYQSAINFKRWTGPDSQAFVKTLGAKGVKRCLVVPISFLFEHIETLYDVDRLIVPAARAAGLECTRAAPPGDRLEIIEALATSAIHEAKEWLSV